MNTNKAFKIRELLLLLGLSSLMVVIVYGCTLGYNKLFGGKEGGQAVGKQWGSPTVEGQIYVITAGRDVVKIPGVPVYAFNEDALREKMKKCREALLADFPKFKNGSQSDWLDFQKQAVWASVTLDQFHSDNFQSTKTDMDGHYSFKLPRTGVYLIISFGERQIFDETEKYFWMTRADMPQRFASYKCDLSNENNVSDAQFPASPEFQFLLLMGHYGLDLPDISH